jgi:hypothetical protein
LQELDTLAVTLFGGYSVVMIGLSSFLGKLWANRIQNSEIERTQHKITELKAKLDSQMAVQASRLESNVHVGKIQYEREFNSYEEIWKEASSLLRKINLLQLHLSSFEFYKKEFFSFGESKVKLEELGGSRFPFIDDGVYSEICECCQIVQSKYAAINGHLNFLCDKANMKVSEEVYTEVEARFNGELDDLINQYYTATVNLGAAIKERNNKMIVVENLL